MSTDWGPPPGPSSAATWAPPPPVAPAPMPGPVPVRPMGLGELIDGAFRLLRADFGPIALAVAAVVLPLQVASFVLTVDLQENLLDTLTQNPAAVGPTLRAFASRLPAYLGVSVVQVLLLLLATAAVTRIGGARYLGLRQSAGDALRSAVRSAPALVGARLLVTLLTYGAVGLPALLSAAGFASGAPVLGGLALFLVLGGVVVAVWLWVVFALAVPAVVLERAGPVESLARSQRLVRGRWWPVFGILLLTGLVVWLVGSAIGAIPSAVSVFFPLDLVGQILATVGATLSLLVTTPASALVVLLLYFDARVRSEGFDLELRGSGTSPG